MKLATVFLVFVNASTALGQNNSTISEIREELFYTEFDINKSLSFYEKLAGLNQATPTIMAYEAAAKALVAKHSWNPVTKISSLKEALNLLEAAVDLDQLNLEIRFLRLYIENSTPPYLGVRKHIEIDKKAILINLAFLEKSDLSAEIVDYIKKYMATAVSCTVEELQLIQASIF